MTDYCPHGVRRGVLCPDCWDAMETEAAATAGVAAGLRLDVAYLRERLAAAEGLAGAVEGLLDVLARVEAGFPPGYETRRAVEDASKAALKAWRGEG